MTDDRDPDLDAWEPQEPSADFAERVVLRVRQEPRPVNRRARVAGAFVLLTAIAASVAVFLARPSTAGDIRASQLITPQQSCSSQLVPQDTDI